MNDSNAEHPPARPRFSLRSLLATVLVVAILLGWWTDRRRLHMKLEAQTQAARFGKLKLYENLQSPEVIGKGITTFPEIPAFADDTGDDSMAPALWDRVAADRKGKECIGYYLQTAELEEGTPGFYVLTINGRIMAVQPHVIVW